MTRCIRLAALSAAMLCAASVARRANAQDIVMAGRVHGTPLPASARRILAKDPHAFEFRRAMKSRLRAAQLARGTQRGLVSVGAPNAVSGATGATSGPLRGTHIGSGPVVNGTERVIVLPILYANTASQPWPTSNLQQRLFDGPSNTETLTQLYTEMSRGNLTMTGTVAPWTTVPGKDTDYEGEPGNNGLEGPGLWNLLKATLDAADQTIDFSKYDDDGDGYVDLVAFVQPETGGECGGNNNMWSHRWVIEGAAGQANGPSDVVAHGYLTNDGVRISDYVLQPALNCGLPATPISIGVFAHEFGHALGLPDLYATGDNPPNEGIGEWGLMGAGNWNVPDSPSHMEAWSKMQLGWAPVQTISTNSHVVLDPVETTGAIARINVPGTSEYFLLENRQRIGSDAKLFAPGLLIWHVDSATVANKWNSNSIENVTDHKGLDLVEANGLGGLDHPGYRGGPGDVFPGSSQNTSWTPTSSPNSSAYAIGVDGDTVLTTGISVTNIVVSGTQVSFDVAFGTQTKSLVQWGDVNADGLVNNADLSAMHGCLLSGSCVGVVALNRGDVDGDHLITLRDALILHSYLVGGIDVSAYHIGQPIHGVAPAVTVQRAGSQSTNKPSIVPQQKLP